MVPTCSQDLTMILTSISTTNRSLTTPARLLKSRLAVLWPLPSTPRAPRSVPVTPSMTRISPSLLVLSSTSPPTRPMPPPVMTRTCKNSHLPDDLDRLIGRPWDEIGVAETDSAGLQVPRLQEHHPGDLPRQAHLCR
jgi:hypothetical protein